MSHNVVTINGKEPDVTGAITGFTPNQIIFVGEGASVDYSGSPAVSTSAGATLYLYDTAPTNTIADSTISASGGWVSSVTLPAGVYQVQSTLQVAFSASGALIFAIAEGGVPRASYARIGALVTSHYSASGIAHTTLKLTSSTTISLQVVSASNVSTVATQGTLIAEHGWLLIRKEAT